MAGGVAAVDGLFMQTITPASTESLNSTDYYSDQKKGCGFNVQAMATADKFVSMTVNSPGDRFRYFYSFPGTRSY